jgi:hypothetical protein
VATWLHLLEGVDVVDVEKEIVSYDIVRASGKNRLQSVAWQKRCLPGNLPIKSYPEE